MNATEAKQVLSGLLDAFDQDEHGDYFYDHGWEVCEAVILAMPYFNRGRWIHDINNLYGCSECMERETMSSKKLKRYCPNCGIKMDGE